MKSVMTAGQKFAQTPKAEIQRSTFNRDHGLKTTFDADELVPIFVDEVLPGDTHKLKANLFGRLATPINPIMDNLYLDQFYFFVPMRLLWSNYYKFFGGQDTPGASTDYTIPMKTVVNATLEGGLSDHMGIPMVDDIKVSALPFRAYWLIFNEWFRDQNLTNGTPISKGDNGEEIVTGSSVGGTNFLIRRAKRHDYFTSCLPFAQKGDEVLIPLSGSAPIYHPGAGGDFVTVKGATDEIDRTLLDPLTAGFGIRTNTTTASAGFELYADLQAATGANINDWRQAFQIQKFLERDARSGTRYTEKIAGHFGVTSPDSRLQRPEYLGGGSSPINVHPVTQTSSTDATTPQGNLSAFGTLSSNGAGFNKSFTEHGYIIGLANVRADLTYQQGVDKLWTRETQYDFFWPSFQNLGEQAVLNKEIYYDGTAADEGVFGYQERYAEYRYKKSNITGLFRSSAASSLDSWHLSQQFTTRPTLGATFIQSSTPLDRVIAVPSEPHIILDAFFDYKSTRPMPVFAPPGMIDHF